MMLIESLPRRVLFLLCGAAVLLAGCVSKGTYNDLEGKYSTLQGQYQTLQGQYSTLDGQYKQLQQTSATQAARSAAELAAVQKELTTNKAQVGRLQTAIKYTVNSDLVFRSGSWEMSPQGEKLIAKLVPQLAPYQQTKLVVNGYTDNAPISKALQKKGVPSNEVLSHKRAEAVMEYLISQGVKPDMIAAQGFGEANPVATNATAKGRAQNRRVEVTQAAPTAP
jgi:chemotaxis protein MotB